LEKTKNITSQLRKGAGDAFVVRVFAFGLSFLMNLLLAHKLNAGDYGTFSYALSFSGLVSSIVPLGLPGGLIRFLSEYSAKFQWAYMWGILKRAHEIVFGASFITALMIWFTSSLLIKDESIKMALNFSAVLLIFLCLGQLRRGILTFFQEIKASIIPDEIILPFTFVCVILFCYNSSLVELCIYYLAIIIVVFVIASIYLWHRWNANVKKVAPKYETSHWLSVSTPLLFGRFGRIIINRTDVIMLGTMADMRTVGLYSAANRLATLNLFVLGAVEAIGTPMLAKSFHSGRSADFFLMVRKIKLWATVGALPGLVIMLGFPKYILGLFGEKFQSGECVLILIVLALGKFSKNIFAPSSLSLIMCGRERLSALMVGAMACLNVTGNLIFIPAYGAVGAACVTASIMIMLSCLEWVAARKLSA
jgi:O-antigen/teichoic acid export membrane protein